MDEETLITFGELESWRMGITASVKSLAP